MANTASAKKAIRVQLRKRKRNSSVIGTLRSAKKIALAKIQSNNPEEARLAVLQSIKRIDKALAKGVVHRNLAARNKSRLTKRLNAILKPI